VDEEGFREVLAVEIAAGEKSAAYASLLRGLLDRGLSGVRLVVSDDHEGIKAAVAGELPGVGWQRCVVHFERNMLSHLPTSEMNEVAEDIKAVFKVRREETARALAAGFVELYGVRFPKAVAIFEAGIEDALTYLSFPGTTTRGYVRPTCWSASSRRSSGERGWSGSSRTRRARAPWPRR
jgi:putative transposase